MPNIGGAVLAVGAVAASAAYPQWLINTGFVWPVFAGMGWLLVWLFRREQRRYRDSLLLELQQRTAAIQPDANGGKSLPDVVRMVREIQNEQRGLIRAFDAHLIQHREDHR